jgi:heme/copper-type cytochrome/quinol oxidase subunit 2
MIKKIKMLILTLSSFFLLAVPSVAMAAVGQTDINGGLNCGANGDFTQTDCQPTDTSSKVNTLITTVVNVISIIVGVIAVIMIIVGGFRYITSAGNPEGAKGARNTILYAIIGLVIVALAQLIVHFVLNKTTAATQ